MERGQAETASLDRHPSPFRIVCDFLEDLLGEVTEQETETPRIVEIPVRYGGEYGPDLEETARYHGITEEALIRRHAEAEYTVYMLGFTPGFPYLGGMAEEIATPRRGTPRLSVPEGSVGIGGKQTGVYPIASPGGWQLIGRTPIRLFRPEQTPPSLLEPGDKVRFRPIGDAEYVLLSRTEQTADGPAAGGGGAGQELRPQTEVGQAPIRVLKPGLYTTVQDLGRTGSQRYGVPWSGAVDAFALRTANVLVGNDEGAAALEVTLAGPELAFAEDTLIAICGGELSPAIDGRPVPAWRPVLVLRGAVLRFGACAAGCRAYVAAAGGIAVPAALGSRSTYVRAALGGHAGRALRRGDELPLGTPSQLARRLLGRLRVAHAPAAGPRGADGPGTPLFTAVPWYVSPDALPAYSREPALRFVRGCEYGRFGAASQAAFETAAYAVAPQSDRMGCRLDGPPLPLAAPFELLSEAVTFGTVQVPPDGSPIVLMADRQTTGGYPRFAQVAAVDLPVLAQVCPGERLSFREIALEEAERLLLEQEAQFERLKIAVRLRLSE